MPRSLADGRIKLAVLTTAPANPQAPTITELAAGIDAAPSVLFSDFRMSAVDSDTVDEKPLSQVANAKALGPSNFEVALTVFRYFDATTKNAHATEDDLYDAIRAKGSELWLYARETAKLSTDAWAASDEIYLGLHVITDNPQQPTSTGGYIKRRVPVIVQDGWPNLTAAAGA